MIKTSYLADKVGGKLIGSDKYITGIFNILGDARKGDVVIRHWVDENGIKMADEKGVSCIVTQNPKGDAIKIAKELDVSLIITEKIEISNAFAIRWSIENFAKKSFRVVVTGTNGKSTTSHMIYNILNKAGYSTYTNTDSKSEFNTLIDPMVAKQIAEFGSEIEAMVIEVSEVQGWLGKIMKNHAYIMTSAVDPDVVVITNVALDHIGLVNSIEEAFDETSGSVKAFEGDYVILNSDDPLVRRMGNFTHSDAKILFYGNGSDIELKDEGIFYRENMLIKRSDLPFRGHHFIQNTMAAIGASIALKIDHEIIRKAVSSYKPLKRRFSILHKKPLIIDDFAHNPDGILATIKSVASFKRKLCVVVAIRGSRGKSINKFNAEAVAEGLEDLDYELIVTASTDVVDDANRVNADEKNVFIETLQKRGINYIFHERLYDAIEDALESSSEDDVILLIGAQGMDPASELLRKVHKKHKKRSK